MAEIKKFAAGEVICEEGKYETFMYVIGAGKAGVYANYGKPNEKQLTVLGENDVIGEMGLLESMPRSATVIALEPVTALKISAANFAEAFEENEEIIFEMMTRMGARLGELTDDYTDACTTIAEYVAAEEANLPKSAQLLEKIKKIMAQA